MVKFTYGEKYPNRVIFCKGFAEVYPVSKPEFTSRNPADKIKKKVRTKVT
jgi:hypothetical protein